MNYPYPESQPAPDAGFLLGFGGIAGMADRAIAGYARRTGVDAPVDWRRIAEQYEEMRAFAAAMAAGVATEDKDSKG